METEARPASWKILLAFAMIYFVWGSTFLAIRVGVHEVPPFLLAAIRFFVAGLALYGWMRLKGTPAPSRREWAGAFFLGTLIFVIDYGCVFWARTARALRNCGCGAGNHSGFHYVAGNHLPANARTDRPPLSGANRGHLWRRGVGESFVFFG